MLAISVHEKFHLLNPKSAKELIECPTPGLRINPVEQSPDGRWAVCASCEQPDTQALVWDLTSRKIVWQLPQSSSCYAAFSPDSRTLYTASREESTHGKLELGNNSGQDLTQSQCRHIVSQ